ncbi:hypothetical protein BDB01DRAFT_853397 [Pilobolus umbonatus]|nr:hypothetical protein BDB01DRAFT_853397 [Pilobolus umbonatus]
MATRNVNKSSIPSLKTRKHKPKVSSPLTVTNVIKNSLNLTASSSSKSLNEEDNPAPDDAHVTPSSEIHKPTHVASTLPLVDNDHISTPEWVLHFQKTFREHERRFAQMDILVDQITYLRTKLEQTQAELEASNARYEQLLAKVVSTKTSTKSTSASTVDPIPFLSNNSAEFPPSVPSSNLSGMSASIHAPPTTYASRAAANVPPRHRRSTI